MRLVYLIWGLVPLLFLFLVLQEILRRVSKKHGKEDIRNYFRQFVYVTIALALTIFCDIFIFSTYAPMIIFGEDEQAILSWLQYPIVLLGMLYFSRFLERRKPTPGSKRRGTAVYRR